MKTIFKKMLALISLGAILSTNIVIAENVGQTYYFDSSNAKEFQNMNYDNFRYVPGDKIVFRAGTIKVKDVGRWGKINYMYGTKEKPIIIEGEVGANGELLSTLDGEGFDLYGDGSNARDLLGIESGKYVIIRNLRFINSWNSTGNAGAIRFVAGDNLVVDNCYFENTQNGVFSYNSGKVTIKNSDFNRAGYFSQDGGGHATYLDAKEVYFVGNHVKNSQFHSFRTRASFTYVENNYIENGANTEVSLFGGNNSDDPNSNIVFIGNVVVKAPSQRDDGLPGNKWQFIQIGERHTPFNFYAYNNTFIIDQDKALDTGSSQKNYARLMQYSDSQTNSNAKSYIKNNVIYGSDKLADAGKEGSYAEFENNIYMSGTIIPTNWTATGNLSVTGSEIFNNYVLNSDNGLSIDGLKLKDESILSPIPASDLKFTDRNGVEHNLQTGLYNETNFSYKFEKGPRQMKSKKYDLQNRCSLKSVGFAENAPDSNCTYSDTIVFETPQTKTFSGFSISGDTKKYNSLSEVPAGKWLEIENTKLQDILSPRSFNSPVRASSGPSAIMGARSSAAFDTTREKMYVFGGGNNDYAGNEVYSFDLNNMWWERLTDPAFPAQGQSLVTSGSHRYFDGTLPARSTYDMIEYDSKNDQMCAIGEYGVYPSGRGGKEVNCFKPSTNSWVQKNDMSVRAVSVGTSVYDKVSGQFYEFDNDTSSFYAYNPNSDTWLTHRLDKNLQYQSYNSEIDSESRTVMMINQFGGVSFSLPAIDSTGSTITTNSFSLFGTGEVSRYAGVTFDSVAKKFIVWGGGKYLFAVSSTGSVEKITSTGDANPLESIPAGTFGRFRYSAKYDSYILANGIDKNIWVYKPDRTASNKIGTPCSASTCVNNTPLTPPETGTGNTSSGTTQTGSTQTGSTISNPTGTTYYFNKENFYTFRDKFFNNLQTKPGDKFIFRAGEYSIKTLAGSWPKINNLSGSIDNPVIIEGEVGANGELLTTLDGAGFDLGGAGSNARDLLDIENSNYVIVRNIKFKNASGNSGNSAGIRFVGGDNLVVDNCYFENDQNGVFAYGSKRLTIKNSEFNKSGYFSTSGGGHGVYLETTELYFVGNHMYNSQMHNFRSRAGFTYMQNNYIENAANTEVSLFGGATTTQDNANVVMIGNVIIKKPSQRADGLPGNSSQFIQIGERTTPFKVFAYDNTFILDQTTASDNGVSQKNDAGLFMFSDTATHNNASVYIKSNIIYGSNRLSFTGKQGKAGEFVNNIYVSGSLIPTGRTASGNIAINDSNIFKNYVINSSNGLTLSGLLLKDENILKPMWSGKLSFVDKSGNTHYLSNGLYNSEENFAYKFNRALTQMTSKKGNPAPRTVIKSVGFGQDIIPKTFTGFKIVGDNKTYNSPNELATGKWLEIDNSKMLSSVDRDFYEAPVRAIVGPYALMSAWGGAAFDTTRERFYLFGGGHGDYAGNDVYSFDVNTMNWDRLKDPSIPPDGVNIKNETTGRNYDGSPVSRHTYDMLEYDPVTDQMCTLGESAVYPSGYGGLHIYCFDPKTNNWNTKKDLEGGSFAYGHGVYDPSDAMFYAFSAAGANFGQYNPKTDTWKITRTDFPDLPNYANNTSFPLGFNADLDPETRTMVLSDSHNIFSIQLPGAGFESNQRPKAVFSTGVYDKVSNTFTGYTAYPGFIYDPVIKKFVTWNEGKKFYYYDPKTKEVTYEDTLGSDKISPNDTHGWYGRFRYSSKYDMYVLINGPNENVFVFKPDRKGIVVNKPSTGTGQTNTGSTNTSSGTTQTPISSGGGGGGGGGGGSSSSSSTKIIVKNIIQKDNLNQNIEKLTSLTGGVLSGTGVLNTISSNKILNLDQVNSSNIEKTINFSLNSIDKKYNNSVDKKVLALKILSNSITKKVKNTTDIKMKRKLEFLNLKIKLKLKKIK